MAAGTEPAIGTTSISRAGVTVQRELADTIAIRVEHLEREVRRYVQLSLGQGAALDLSGGVNVAVEELPDRDRPAQVGRRGCR